MIYIATKAMRGFMDVIRKVMKVSGNLKCSLKSNGTRNITGTMKRSWISKIINTLFPGKFETIPFSSKIFKITAVDEKENNTANNIAICRLK